MAEHPCPMCPLQHPSFLLLRRYWKPLRHVSGALLRYRVYLCRRLVYVLTALVHLTRAVGEN